MPYIATLDRAYGIDAVLDNRGASGIAASSIKKKT
jgi:hypothetical protein